MIMMIQPIVKRQVSDYYGTGKKKYDEFYGYNDSLEKKVNYGYDILTRHTDTVVDPDNLAITVSFDYDAAGNRISTTDPKDSIIHTEF